MTYGVGLIAPSTASDPGLPATFSVVSGPGSISGNTRTVTGAGSIDVEGDQVGNAGYAASTPVQQTLVFNKAASVTTTVGTALPFTNNGSPQAGGSGTVDFPTNGELPEKSVRSS